MLSILLFLLSLCIIYGQNDTDTNLCIHKTQVINTDKGPVTGCIKNNVNVFHSIPFAEAPVGNNRLRPPQDKAPWTESIDTFKQPNICPQLRTIGEVYLGDEDCLYLHVYTPPNAIPGTKLPVMFFIYGGGFRLGDGYQSIPDTKIPDLLLGLYDGSRLAAEQNVIVVAPNYRLDVLGFFSHPDLQAEEGAQGSTGNYGVQDQRAALEWVQRNIETFGGDKERVTIFGESAGGFSVCWHVGSPQSKGLFSAAIMESGSCSTDFFFRPFDLQVAFSKLYATHFGCDDTQPGFVDCLRSKPVGEMLAPIQKFWPNGSSTDWPIAFPPPPLFPVMSWGPVLDKSDIGTMMSPYDSIKNHLGSDVPFMLGSNKDEGSLLVYGIYLILKANNVTTCMVPLLKDFCDVDMPVVLAHFFPEPQVVTDALNMYPKSSFASSEFPNTARASALLRDFFFLCEARRSAVAMSNNGNDVYLYHFIYPIHWVEKAYGDYHAVELEFLFGNEVAYPIHIYNEADKAFEKIMMNLWGSFAHNHSPIDTWPKYTKENDINMLLDSVLTTQKGLGDLSFCNFWDHEFALYYPSQGLSQKQQEAKAFLAQYLR